MPSAWYKPARAHRPVGSVTTLFGKKTRGSKQKTQRLGAAIAKLLAAEGPIVVVHGRSESRAHAVAEAITNAGGHAEIALGDLTSDAGADAVAKKAHAGGAIDILVNNAGTYHHRNWTTATPD
jgi:3-oxoacyl-[acyl-carrier protein] reductase